MQLQAPCVSPPRANPGAERSLPLRPASLLPVDPHHKFSLRTQFYNIMSGNCRLRKGWFNRLAWHCLRLWPIKASDQIYSMQSVSMQYSSMQSETLCMLIWCCLCTCVCIAHACTQFHQSIDWWGDISSVATYRSCFSREKYHRQNFLLKCVSARKYIHRPVADEFFCNPIQKRATDHKIYRVIISQDYSWTKQHWGTQWSSSATNTRMKFIRIGTAILLQNEPIFVIRSRTAAASPRFVVENIDVLYFKYLVLFLNF